MIEVYTASTNDFTQADYTEMYSLLDCALKAKINAKKNDIDRQSSIIGYSLFCRGAKKIYNKTQFEIVFNEHGKPLCDFCYFSISHSEGNVICVFSDKPVGVDIQKISTIKAREKYKFFTLEESFYVNQNPEQISRRFIEIFTKKESAVKMLGQSISVASHIDTFSDKFCFESVVLGDFVYTVCQKNEEIM